MIYRDGTATVWHITGQAELLHTIPHTPLSTNSPTASPSSANVPVSQVIKETRVKQVLWSPNGKLLATQDQKNLKVWDLPVRPTDSVLVG
jgi:WD40 repeat protein